jgi:hypothetical protein
MNKKIIFLIAFFALFIASNSFAQAVGSGNQEDSDQAVRNPFEPWLPNVVVEPKGTAKPAVKATVKPEPRRVDRTTRAVKPPVHLDRQKPVEIKPPDLRITGLVWNTNRPQAIINEKVVDVGDSIEDAIIVAINKTGIEISFQGQTMTVTP